MTEPLNLDELERLERNATPGPWTTDKPAVDPVTGFRRGVAVAATYGRQMIYADPPGGSFPAADQIFIAAIRNAAADLIAAAMRGQAAQAEIGCLQGVVYVPGLFKCKKCGFTLVQRTLRACDGAVGVRDQPGENCPNCSVPLWRVSEREAGNELADRSAEYLQRASEVEKERDFLRVKLAKATEALKPFSCVCTNWCYNRECDQFHHIPNDGCEKYRAREVLSEITEPNKAPVQDIERQS